MIRFPLHIKRSPPGHIGPLFISVCSSLDRFRVSQAMVKQSTKPYIIFCGSATQEPWKDSVACATKRTHPGLAIVCNWVKKPRTRFIYGPVFSVDLPRNGWFIRSKDEMEAAEALLSLKYGHCDEKVVCVTRKEEEEEKGGCDDEKDPWEIEKNVTSSDLLKYGDRDEEVVSVRRKEEEEVKGDDENDPWKIRKNVTSSDLGHLSRLMLSSKLVKQHILPLLDKDTEESIEKGGHEFVVWDVDTRTEHTMVFKKWISSNCYIFIKGWTQSFVKRRKLMKDDQIGLYYDKERAIFYFTVLKEYQANQDQE